MAMSPTEAYAVWIDHVTKAMHSILDSFKDGAFKNDINEKMSVTTMFNVMLESSIVTAEEKKILRLGRDLTAPFRAAPCVDEVHCRMGRYFKEVVPIFFDGQEFELPPVQIIKPDGTADFALKMGEDGRPVAVPAGPPGLYPSLEMGQGRATLFTYPGQTPRPPLAELLDQKQKKASKIKKGNIEKKTGSVTPVHPSVILSFPDVTDPRPDEVDNYPLVMDWIWGEVSEHVKTFKNGAFKDRIKDTMTISKVFKVLIGSSLTTPSEKDILRHGHEWVEYLENRFGGLVRLSRFHSLCYSGVFLEKVFCIFRNGSASTPDTSENESKPERLWSLRHVAEGVNDRIVVGEDWNLVRIPEDRAVLKGEPPNSDYSYKMTHDGVDLVTALGKVKSLSIENGIIKDYIPAVPEMNQKEGFNDKAFATITKSWMGENPTRKRTRTGQYGVEEMRENALALQQTLGRLPTTDEFMLDMISAIGAGLVEEEEKNPGSTGGCDPM